MPTFACSNIMTSQLSRKETSIGNETRKIQPISANKLQRVQANTMWNFASHAGTGLAVAGLSATYYALARKTYQLERESSLSATNGQDSGDASTLSHKITPSQLLLKKELHFLGRNSGHAIGLNAFNSPVPLQPKSNLTNSNLRHIRSRFELVNATSVEEESPKHNENAISPAKSKPSADDSLESLNVFAVEEFSSLEFSEDSQALPTKHKDPQQSHNPCPPDKVKPSSPGTGDVASIADTTNDSRDMKFAIHKTESPIVFYKNPVFANDDEQQSAVTLQTQKLPADAKDQDQMTTIDDIKDYNLKLTTPRPRQLQNHPPSNPKQEVVAEKPEVRGTFSSKSLPDLMNNDEYEESSDIIKLDSEGPEEFVSCCSQKVEDVLSTEECHSSQEQIFTDYANIEWNPRSSFLQRISTFCSGYFQPRLDSLSFASLSYEDAYKLVVLISCLIVVIVGFLGRFIGKGFDWFLEMQSTLEADDNPEAILDH